MFFRKLILLVIILSSAGCATYQSKVAPARDLLVSGQCEASLKILEELSQKEDGDQLVHLMDYGSALQICGDYKKSNSVLYKAERLSEQVDYTSASRVLGATLANEEMIQYKGDTFEKLFLNAMMALNYIQLNQMDDALIEVRKMNQKFVKLQAEEKKSFELNSFSKYLSGLIWEADKKYDDACIDFKDAYQIDPSFKKVISDVLRSCWKAKRNQEYDEFAKKNAVSAEEIKNSKHPSKSELIVIYLQGWGPRKQPRPENHLFPYLVAVPSKTQFLKIEQLNQSGESVVQTYQTEPVYSVEKAAIATLNADYNSLVARRVGARVAKSVVADQVRQKNELLGNLALIAMVVSERADLRQWSIFPKTIQIARIPVEAGVTQSFKLTGLDSGLTQSERLTDLSINLRPGEKKFQIIRTMQ